MKRKDERIRKKRIRTLSILAAFVALIACVALGAFAYPYFIAMISGQEEVKSAFVTQASMEKVKDLLASEKIAYTKIEYADEGETYLITLKSEEVVKLSGSKNVEAQVSTLQKLLRKLTIDNRKATQIDLRYSRPVVKF